MYPLVLIALGIFFCILVSILSTHIMRVETLDKIESTLKMQLILSTILLLGVIPLSAYITFPPSFNLGTTRLNMGPWTPFVCSVFGLISGMLIAAFTEYVTSHAYKPVR